jgi:hypothetical protein
VVEVSLNASKKCVVTGVYVVSSTWTVTVHDKVCSISRKFFAHLVGNGVFGTRFLSGAFEVLSFASQVCRSL